MAIRRQTTGTAVVSDARAAFVEAVAPEAIETAADRLRFTNAQLLPLTLRANSLPGMPQRPWGRVSGFDFLPSSPGVYSVAVRREAPEALRSGLRVRRTLMEGVLLALAEKTGRRPSMAERTIDGALDEAESRLALGDPAFRTAVLTGIYTTRERTSDAEAARRALEVHMRARGFQTQRLVYIPERSIHHFQPGGLLFPGVNEPILLLEEAARLLPHPSRAVPPAPDAVWLGSTVRDGRDVYFSPRFGLDPSAPQPPHATTLLLGEMGSGKTSLMRSILLQRLMQGRRIISLDPEGENNRLCEASGGRVVPAALPADPQTCLLHPLEADTAGELLIAVRFLIAALNGAAPLSALAQAAVHDVVQSLWNEAGDAHWPLADLVDRLRAAGPDAAEVCALLHPFSRGGLWDGFFDRPRALLSHTVFDEVLGPDSGAWWNFDLSGLREENKAIVHAVLVWFLYRVISVTQAPIDVFLDEGWRLLRSPTFSALLDELGRRARKRGIGIVLATHLPEDLLNNPSSLSLASTAFVGRLGPRQAEAFLHSLGVPEERAQEHAAAIAQLPPHHFYAVPGGGRSSLFPLRVRLPPGWLETWAAHGAAR